MAVEIFRAFYRLWIDEPGLASYGSNAGAHEVPGHAGARALDGDLLTTWNVLTTIGATHPTLTLTWSPAIAGGGFDIWVGLFNHNTVEAGVETILIEGGPIGGPFGTIMRIDPRDRFPDDDDQVHVLNNASGNTGEIHIEFEHSGLTSTLSIGQILFGLAQVDFDELPTEQIDGEIASVAPGTRETPRGILIGRGGFGLRETFPIGGENLTPAQADKLLTLWKAQRGVAPFALHMDDHDGADTAWDTAAIPGETNIDARGGAYLVQPGSQRMGYRRLHSGRRTVSFSVHRQIP